MARRAGTMATEVTDYSERRIFLGPHPAVPTPFARHEDFAFTTFGSLLAPTANLLALLDRGRPLQTASGSVDQVPGAVLDDVATAMLERELLNCAKAKSVFANEPAGPLLRDGFLWGRFAEVAGEPDAAARAESFEHERVQQGMRLLFLESDANFGQLAFRYGWTATLLLERFAETSGLREVAEAAWSVAAEAHRYAAGQTSVARLRKAHGHMAEICGARAKAIPLARHRQLSGFSDRLINLQGHSTGARRW